MKRLAVTRPLLLLVAWASLATTSLCAQSKPADARRSVDCSPGRSSSSDQASDTIQGQGYGDKGWTTADLIYGGPDSELEAKVRQMQQRRRDLGLGPPSGVNVDIGDIAVVEDDGTLIVVGTQESGGQTDTTAIVQSFYRTHSDDRNYCQFGQADIQKKSAGFI